MVRTRTLIWTLMAFFVLTFSTHAIAGGAHTGTVLDAQTGGGYTYMQIEENGKQFWIAGPESSIGAGEQVTFFEQVWMSNFKSKALNRTFDQILFVGSVRSASASHQAPAAKSPAPAAAKKKSKDFKPNAGNSYTIQELFDNKYDLHGKTVKVKGKVIKVSDNIMGHSWVHIKDDSGPEVVFRSSTESASVGETVTAEGRLEADKDFGSGYFYPVIVEDSTFSK